MKFTAQIRNIGEKSAWSESFNESDVTTQEQAEKWIEETVKWFNSALRDGELPREVLGVTLESGDAPLSHHWTKTNLVTLSDHRGTFDNVKCERCGATARRYGLTAIKRSAKFKGKKWVYCHEAELEAAQQKKAT